MSSGTTFYIDNGFKAVIAKVPEDIKLRLNLMANNISCSKQDLYKDIFQDYIENQDKYNINHNLGNKQITVYLPKKMHKKLKHIAIVKDIHLKEIISSVIISYFKERSLVEKGKKRILGRNQKDTA